MSGNQDNLSDFSMADLFRMEAENQLGILISGLLQLEQNPSSQENLESLMRAAHSIKGAARIVNFEQAVRISHQMEDLFVSAQEGRKEISRRDIDVLLQGVDLIKQISDETNSDSSELIQKTDFFLSQLVGLADLSKNSTIASSGQVPNVEEESDVIDEPTAAASGTQKPTPSDLTATAPIGSRSNDPHERSLRVTAANLDRLLGLAGEFLVESRWLKTFSESLLKLKRQQGELAQLLDTLRSEVQQQQSPNETNLGETLAQTQTKLASVRHFLGERLSDLDRFDRRATNLSQAIYEETRACRMRPLQDGIQGFPRMIRDLSRQLGKEISYQVVGENTQVDRDVLERLEPPLTHLLRNAVDHGIEMPDAREAAGKNRTGMITMEARHIAGMLQIVVSDDGQGINYDSLRRKIVKRDLTTPEIAEKLTVPELLEFLFLPGFSMRDSVTELSGRGVGLDIVQSMIKSVHGTIRVSSDTGRGIRFQLQLPLTLSVARTLIVEISNEPYALPLAHITKTISVARNDVLMLEGKYHFSHLGQQVGLVWAHQVLEKKPSNIDSEALSVVLLNYHDKTYGLVVSRFIGEREMVIQPLDLRLGKIRDISSGGLLEDGSPVLILDTSDVVRSIDKLISGGGLSGFLASASRDELKSLKRVLIVDDSLTVRELERKLLQNAGYAVDVAVDGMDAWNAIRSEAFDLVVTDVDMPRMDGVELVKLIKKDSRLNSIPVLIVSYKDREEDRQRGLDAGADYYLTKGSFHDETLINAVRDLIGEPKG